MMPLLASGTGYNQIGKTPKPKDPPGFRSPCEASLNSRALCLDFKSHRLWFLTDDRNSGKWFNNFLFTAVQFFDNVL